MTYFIREMKISFLKMFQPQVFDLWNDMWNFRKGESFGPLLQLGSYAPATESSLLQVWKIWKFPLLT